MHLDHILERNTFFDQKLADVASVVSLKLDDGAPLVVVHCGTVAAPRFFESSDNLLQIQVLGQTLYQGETLSRRALLKVQVDNVVSLALLRIC